MKMMFRQKVNNGGCFNATAVKITAVFFMTLDHIGAKLSDVPVIAGQAERLRMLGRIAAPLFLFLVAESAGKTMNKKRYFIRMLAAAEITAALNFIAEKLIGGIYPVGFSANILHTFVWVIGASYMIELGVKKWKDGKYVLGAVCIVSVIAAAALTIETERLLLKGSYDSYKVFHYFIRSPRSTDYSGMFILLGIAWYFLKTKLQRCLLFFIIALVPMFWPFSIPYDIFFTLVQSNQWTMIGALPIMLLYNGKRGKGFKYFFYAYYPLHIYLIEAIHILITK